MARLTYIRRSWPLVASAGLVLYWWALAQLIFPRIIVFNPLENVDYWSLISLSGHKSAVIYVFAWALFIGLAGITVFYAWDYYGNLLLIGSCLLIAIACLGSLCIGYLTLFWGLRGGYTLEHVQSMIFNQRIYQLAVSIEHYDDFNVGTYLVFECDSSGNICRWLQSSPYYPLNNQPATLVTENDSKLYFKQGSRRTQLKP